MIQDADEAQQVFSSDQHPSLHLALPALETLYFTWDRRSNSPKYQDFVQALDAGKAKVDEYYKKAQSPSYTLSMSTLLT